MSCVAWISLIASMASCTPPTVNPRIDTPPKRATSHSKVVLLGTGTPNAEPERSGPAVAIVANGVPYLVDCGPGVIRRAAAAHQAGVTALNVPNIKHLFITHLHSDHTVGYPDVILTPWVLGRDKPLQVFGPPGIKAMTDHILKAYEEDIRIRTGGSEPANTAGYRVDAHEIRPGIVYKDANVTVRAFPVRHGSWPHAFGFRFDTPDRSIVVSGDTTPVPTLVEHARGCDVLVHEVYAEAGFKRRQPDWQRYHASFHASSRELARIAMEVQPGLLILYHQLYWGATEEELLAEIREVYPGPVVSGRDLDVY